VFLQRNPDLRPAIFSHARIALSNLGQFARNAHSVWNITLWPQFYVLAIPHTVTSVTFCYSQVLSWKGALNGENPTLVRRRAG
jgi:hypothetical protein